MREAHVILPLADNDGADLSTQHLDFADALESAFGAYTYQTSTVHGVWTDESTGLVYRDTSTEYRIARNWDAKALDRLERIAAQACRAMGQECVYLKDPAGEVFLISPGAGMASPKWADEEAA